MYKLSIMQFPHVRLTAAGLPRVNQPLTADNVQHILDSVGLKLRMNMMLNRFEFSGADVGVGEVGQTDILMRLEDTLTMLDISGLPRLYEMLERLAARNERYHPMEEWLLSSEWDGRDRLERLTASVPTDSEVWPEYLRKWLIQAVEAVRGWRSEVERSIPHVLVFVGGQGGYKGRWLRSLAPGFVMADAELHLSSYGSKDHQLQALRFPVVELGEIDSTFKKSEVSALKSFLSRPVDVLRSPYARVAVTRPRMTVFAGSVNNMEFLNDPTGARRFWPVRLDGPLEWDHGLDMQQVFAQANVYWNELEDWNLENLTQVQRTAEVEQFVQSSAAVDLVSAWVAKHGREFDRYAAMNKTEICRIVGGGMHPADLGYVSEWLTKNLGPARRIGGRFRCWPFPIGSNPFQNYHDFLDKTEMRVLMLAWKVVK